MKKAIFISLGLLFISFSLSSFSPKEEVLAYTDCVEQTFDFYESLEDSPFDDEELACLGNGFYAVCMGYSWDGSC